MTSATYWKNGRAYSGALAYAVAILGSILVSALPDHRVALLFCYWISGAPPLFAPRYTYADLLSWMQ